MRKSTVGTTTRSRTQAKVLTAVTVLAAGVLAYAVATVSTPAPDQTTTAQAAHDACIQACHTDACVNACPALPGMFALRGDLSLESLPAATINQYYQTRFTINAFEHEQGSWSVLEGALPPGMQLDQLGALYGTPIVADHYRFAVQLVIPAVKGVRPEIRTRSNVELVVNAVSTTPSAAVPAGLGDVALAPTTAITTPVSDLSMNLHQAYRLPLAVQGVPSTDSAAWSLTYGQLPTGITLDAKGTLVGTPTATGTFSFGLGVSLNSNAAVTVATQDAHITVVDPAVAAAGASAHGQVEFTPAGASLPDGRVGTFSSFYFSITAGASDYTWSTNTLPDGMELDPVNHVIYGTPRTAGTYQIKFALSKGTETQQKSYTWNVAADLSTITITNLLNDGLAGENYQTTLSATGGSGGYQWSFQTPNTVSSAWTLSQAGVLAGHAPRAGIYTFPVRVQDIAANVSAQALLTLNVRDVVAPDNTPKDTAAGTITLPTNSASTSTVTTTSTTTELAFSNVGSYPDGNVSYAYNARPFEVVGGTAPYTYHLLSGSLPDGLSLDSSGYVTGTPVSTSTSFFVMTVTDAAHATIRASRVIVIRTAQERTANAGSTVTVNAATLARLDAYTRAGVHVHDLVKLQDDGDASTQEDSTVYYLGADGRRHAFPNPHVYFSWFADFSAVRIISATDLATLPLGANITYHPGTRLVKFLSVPDVFVVDLNRNLRKIRTEAEAQQIYGTNWAQNVDDISDAFFMDYHIADPITDPAAVRPSALSSSVQWPSDILPQQ